MATDTNVQTLIINKGTLANLPTDRDPTQLYVATDAPSNNLPDQTGHSGVLQTNGTVTSWNDNIKVNSTSILLTNTAQPAVNGQIVIGNGAGGPGNSGVDNVIIGDRATAANYGVALGADAKAAAESSVQIGAGTNSEAGTVCFATGTYPNQKNVTLLNNQGFIPADALADGGTEGQILAVTATGLGWVNPSAGASVASAGTYSEYGVKGDYCSTYAVIKTPNGRPVIKSGATNTVTIPAGMVIDCAPSGDANDPSTSLITIASEQDIELDATTDCYLVYVKALGEFRACNTLCFTPETPADGSEPCKMWFNGSYWQFKSDDTGNVWRPTRAHPVAKCIFTNGTLTRLNFIGWYDIAPDAE